MFILGVMALNIVAIKWIKIPVIQITIGFATAVLVVSQGAGLPFHPWGGLIVIVLAIGDVLDGVLSVV